MSSEVKKRSTWFDVWFWLFVIGNVAGVYTHLLNPGTLNQAISITHTPLWQIRLVGMISLIQLGMLYGVRKWKKWGVYGFGAAVIVSNILNLIGGKFVPAVFSLGVMYLIYRYIIKPIWSKFG